MWGCHMFSNFLKLFSRDYWVKKAKEARDREDRLFEPVINVLQEFGINHNLKFERHSHGGPGPWFLFRNPKGGYCVVKLLLAELEDSVKIKNSWHVSDFNTMKMHNRIETNESFFLDESHLKELLEKNLTKILSWERNQLDMVMNIQMGQVTKAEHEKIDAEFLEALPFPKT
jgi:hypothetical protein